MNKNIFALFALSFFLINFSSALNVTGDSLDVYTSIYATQEWAQIELNITEIDFGWINVSEPLVAQKRKSFTYGLKNRGNINITIKPRLVDSSDSLFSNLYFSKKTSDSLGAWKQIGEYNVSLNATTDNNWASNSFAIHLKLDNYLSDVGGIIPFNEVNRQNTVIFDIIPRYE